MKRAALIPILKAALDALPAEPAPPAFVLDPATLGRYAGTYRAGTAGMTMTVIVQEGTLTAQVPGQPAFRLTPSAAGVFRVPEVAATLTFTERGGLAESIQSVQGPATIVLSRITADAAAISPTAPAAPVAPTAPVAPSPPRCTAQLAVVPRRRRPRQWRRPARGHRMGRHDREEHQVEDTDTWHRELQPRRVGQSRVRDDGNQQSGR